MDQQNEVQQDAPHTCAAWKRTPLHTPRRHDQCPSIALKPSSVTIHRQSVSPTFAQPRTTLIPPTRSQALSGGKKDSLLSNWEGELQISISRAPLHNMSHKGSAPGESPLRNANEHTKPGHLGWGTGSLEFQKVRSVASPEGKQTLQVARHFLVQPSGQPFVH